MDRIPGHPPCASVMVSEQEIETLSPDHSGSKVESHHCFIPPTRLSSLGRFDFRSRRHSNLFHHGCGIVIISVAQDLPIFQIKGRDGKIATPRIPPWSGPTKPRGSSVPIPGTASIATTRASRAKVRLRRFLAAPMRAWLRSSRNTTRPTFSGETRTSSRRERTHRCSGGRLVAPSSSERVFIARANIPSRSRALPQGYPQSRLGAHRLAEVAGKREAADHFDEPKGQENAAQAP